MSDKKDDSIAGTLRELAGLLDQPGRHLEDSCLWAESLVDMAEEVEELAGISAGHAFALSRAEHDISHAKGERDAAALLALQAEAGAATAYETGLRDAALLVESTALAALVATDPRPMEVRRAGGDAVEGYADKVREAGGANKYLAARIRALGDG